jgi:superfamily II DNA or RNA helicase
MTKLEIFNSLTVVTSDDEAAITFIEDSCTLVYEFFIRRKGSPRAQRKSRELRYFSKKDPQFPTGWVGKISTELRRYKIPYVIDDKRNIPPKINLPVIALPNDPWDHQQEALIAIQENERGIVRVPTRGGKTLIMAMSIAYFQVPTVVIVPNNTLLTQEYEVFSQVFGEERVGMLGNGYQDYEKDVLVATTQTLYSRMDDFWTQICVFKRRGCVLLDECHHINHGGYKLRNTYFEIAQRCEQAYYRIGFTATPGKTTSLERKLLNAVAGKMIFSVGIEDLKRKEVLTPARVNMVVINRPHTITLREYIQNQGVTIPRGADLELLCRRYRIPIPSIPTFQDQLESKITKDHKFRKLVKRLAEHYSKDGKAVIVTVSRIEEGVQVFSDPNSPYYIDGSIGLHGKSERRSQVLEEFRQGDFSVLISTLVKEGVDLPRADVLILAACDVISSTPVLQRAGRVLTRHEGKEKAIIVDFYISDNGVLERHSKERMKLYDENAFEIEIMTSKQALNEKSDF